MVFFKRKIKKGFDGHASHKMQVKFWTASTLNCGPRHVNLWTFFCPFVGVHNLYFGVEGGNWHDWVSINTVTLYIWRGGKLAISPRRALDAQKGGP